MSSFRGKIPPILALLVCISGAGRNARAQGVAQSHNGALSGSHSAAPGVSDPQKLFQQGEAALKSGDLDQAERSFRGVLALNPKVAGAYANLGVIYMRRKQWKSALKMLHKGETLAPGIAGIRLNIGLAYYRENDFRSAISPFQSVVRDVPDSFQARYLLGLCHFFIGQYADAEAMLEPLWARENSNLNYLYVLGIAAHKTGNSNLEEQALGRLVEIGQNSAEFHLLMGKAHINREEYDDAIRELQLASRADTKLPFVHFNLGLAYLKKQDLDNAKTEFLEDAAVEPDLADDYDQLGLIYFLQQEDQDAENNLRKALRLDPQLTSAHYELARVFQRQEKYSAALAEVDAALKLEPNGQSLHYLRGQILQRLGRTEDARAEMARSARIMNEARGKRQRELESGPLPSPELSP